MNNKIYHCDFCNKDFENIEIRFTFEEEYRKVSLIKYDADLDISLLKLDDITDLDLKPLVIGDTSNLKQVWNEFLYNSRTPMFMFDRNFMEYHSDRFIDYSLLFYEEDPKCRKIIRIRKK